MRKCKWHLISFVGLILLLVSSAVTCAKPTPAQFEVVSLNIIPPEVVAGETATATAQVRNIGGSEGVYTAILTVDKVEIETKNVAVAPGATEIVTFSLARAKAGTYQVAVGGLTSSLAVEQKLVAKEVELKYVMVSNGISFFCPAETDIWSISCHHWCHLLSKKC